MRMFLLGAVVAGGVLVADPAGGAHGAPGSDRGVAQAEAARALSSVSLPPGWARVAADPSGGALAAPEIKPLTPRLVDRHAFWRVSGSPQSVLGWVQSHLPAGSQISGSGEASGPRGPLVRLLTLSFAHPPAGIVSNTLVVAATALRTGGSAVRGDAEVVWRLSRPGWAVVPAGVRVIRVSVQRSGMRRVTVTSPARVRRIVGLVNRLPVWQLGGSVANCPADLGPIVKVAFFRRIGDRVPVAVAKADASGCRTVVLSTRGRTAPVLSGGPQLISALGIA